MARVLLMAVMCAACGEALPRVGRVVSPGVAEALFEHRAAGARLVRTHVVYPATDDGAPRGGAHPAVVFIQGGLVPSSRYRWWGEALAKEGYVVALPEHELDLAFFTIDNGADARALLAAPPSSLLSGLVDPKRIAVAGHSLGGVVAVKLALQGGFQALLLEASLPDVPDEAPLGYLAIPSLSLAGQNDCSASLASVTKGAKALRAPTALVVLDGVTHYQFTDRDTEDVARRCASGVDLDTAHARIIAASRAFLDAALSDAPGVGAEALKAIAGAEVTVR